MSNLPPVVEEGDEKQKKRLWPKITEHRVRGRVYFVMDLGRRGSGRRERQVFKTKGEAEMKAAQARAARENEGAAAFGMPAAERADATKALAILKPYGASLTEAAKHYQSHVLAFREAPCVSEIVDKLLKEAERLGRRGATVAELRHRLKRFAATYGERQLSGITRDELMAWLNDPTWSRRTRINYHTKLSQLYSYARKQKWVSENLVADLSRPEAEDAEVEFFTVEQAGALLDGAEPLGLLPFVAFGLFCGIRSAELQRLTWDAVRWGERCVIIAAGVAKKRSRRVIELNDAALAWLGGYHSQQGKIVPHTHQELKDRMTKLRENAERVLRKAGGAFVKHADGLKKWKHNGLRHTFATMHYAMQGDALATARCLGHAGVDVLVNHYKGLATKQEAARFWALRPPEGAENIISISA